MSTAHRDAFRRGAKLQTEALAAFSEAFWSDVPLVAGEDLAQAVRSAERVLLVFTDRGCEACAVLLDELEAFAAARGDVACYRHDLGSTNPPGWALHTWPDPAAPPSKTGQYHSQIPALVYFEAGEPVRRAYGAGADLRELVMENWTIQPEGAE